LDITAHNKQLFRGVVGNLSEVIGTDKFKPLFLELCKDPRYVGYRLSGRYQDELSDELFRDLELTAKKGRTVDFLVGGYSLEDVAKVAKRIPDLKIIMDHFGGVRLGEGPLTEEWIKQFRAVAKHPNVYCKVSALFGRFKEQPAPQTIETYRPILDLAFECFGEERLVFGSDWPVTRQTDEYAAVLKLTRAYFDTKGREASEKLFYKNAMRFYGVELETARP
ncbi:MAG: amidohydrolase family protein, partial [Planctomycetota bacterium]